MQAKRCILKVEIYIQVEVRGVFARTWTFNLIVGGQAKVFVGRILKTRQAELLVVREIMVRRGKTVVSTE